jgi:AcrR family transcriptional regulator
MAGGTRASRSARGSGRLARRVGGGAPQEGNGAVRDQLSDIQRARILSAMFEVATQRGASNVTVANVVERSGVSRRTFYELFTDCDDCFLAAFEDAVSFAAERVLPAYEAENGWSQKIRAGLIALLCFLDEQPAIGRVLIVESFSGAPGTSARRKRLISTLTEAIERGREQTKVGIAIPSLTGEGIVGGVLTVIHSRLMEQDGEPLVKLANPLMSMIVLPYLGAAAARRELERSVPVQAASPESAAMLSDPFKDAGMRLTYRTVRVLMAIADQPNASNRVIADTAEIKDQGQISKLLGRLERAGMVANSGLGPGLGAPNSWTLTTNGRQVAHSIRTHTEGHSAFSSFTGSGLSNL